MRRANHIGQAENSGLLVAGSSDEHFIVIDRPSITTGTRKALFAMIKCGDRRRASIRAGIPSADHGCVPR